MPHHRALDRVVERYLGSARIGTTGRGIGPAYGDKVARMGIRVQDLLDPGILRKKLELVLREKNQILVKVYNRKAIDVDAVVEEYLAYAERLRPYIADTRLRCCGEALERGETVLLEGAQATHARRGPRHLSVRDLVQPDRRRRVRRRRASRRPRITQVIGVIKAYTTRVGSGPFPTELFDDNGAHLRKVGARVRHDHRPGAALRLVRRGRRRGTRCGVNGITDLVVTKLDVLSGLEQVPICVGYEIDGERVDDMPMTQTDVPPRHAGLRGAAGWWEDISKARTFERAARRTPSRYVERIEELCGTRVSVVGVGPGREENVIRHELLPPRS